MSKVIFIGQKDVKALGYFPLFVELREISEGDTGQDVKLLQFLLDTLGYAVGSRGIDGYYGSMTTDAVASYQKDANLVVDGECGMQTWESLAESVTYAGI